MRQQGTHSGTAASARGLALAALCSCCLCASIAVGFAQRDTVRRPGEAQEFRVEIRENGVKLRSPQNRMIGQAISLQGVVLQGSTVVTPTSHRWVVPGTTVKSYTQTLDSATKVDLGAADLEQPTVSFYWIDDDNNLVEYHPVVDGKELSMNVQFIVLRPNASQLQWAYTTDNPKVQAGVEAGNPDPGKRLHFGNRSSTAATGCHWSAHVSTGKYGAGEVGFTQLINATLTYLLREDVPHPNGRNGEKTSNGVPVLDDPYGIVFQRQGLLANGSVDVWANDTPSIPLTTLDRASALEAFDTYLVYRPQGANSIWVPLRRLHWGWHGTAIRDTQTDQWSTENADADQCNGWTIEEQLPLWTGRWQAIQIRVWE